MRKPGSPEKFDYEYKRKGTCNILVAVEPKRGMRFCEATDIRTKSDFAFFIFVLAEIHFPDAKCIQMVLDNLNTDFEQSLIETFGKQEANRLMKRIKFIYTPKHASYIW